MDLKEFTGRNDLEGFQDFYETAVAKLGGPEAVRPYIPFDAPALLASYRKDPNFNDALTPLKTWDAATGIATYRQSSRITVSPGGLWPLLHAHGVTALSQSQAVCILKTAAAMLAESGALESEAAHA